MQASERLSLDSKGSLEMSDPPTVEPDGPNDAGHWFRDKFVIRQPRMPSRKMPLDCEPRPVVELLLDGRVPASRKAMLGLAAAYLASPIDLIPDFIPVIGYADDAVVVVLALRAVARRAGPEALRRHWPGSTDALAAVCQLAGVRAG